MRGSRVLQILVLFGLCRLVGAPGGLFAQGESTPLEFLKEQELKNKDQKGEVYLGKVMTITYPAAGTEPGARYHPLLLELTDVLKTPLRENYRMVLKGYADGTGSSERNLSLSKKRAATLRNILIKRYYMTGSRIAAEGLGTKAPVASDETPGGRSLNRRVEIHVYGDVSEAVRFSDK